MDQNTFNKYLTEIEVNGFDLDSQKAVDIMFEKFVQEQTPISSIVVWANERESGIFPITKKYILEALSYWGKDISLLNLN